MDASINDKLDNTNASNDDLRAASDSRLGALNMAIDMLRAIELGKQYNCGDWHCRLRAIEKGRYCGVEFGDGAICHLGPDHFGGHAD